MGSGSLTVQAAASIRARIQLCKHLSVRPKDLATRLESEGASPEVFLQMALSFPEDRALGMTQLLQVRRSRGISWEQVGHVLRLNRIAPESAVVWEERGQKQAARVLGVPHWFLEGCQIRSDEDWGQGILRLQDFSHVEGLPENLLLGGLELTRLKGFTHLPEHAVVLSRVALDDVPDLSNWPSWLQDCQGRVAVRNCPGLGTVPLEKPPRSLRLDFQPFPERGLVIGRLNFLELGQIKDLVALPEHLDSYSLGLSDCSSLKSLPRTLREASSEGEGSPHLRGFQVERCACLTALPDQANYPGHVGLLQCPNLRSLGSGLHVGGNLTLAHLPRLEALPSWLHVPGSLNLENLPRLSNLGEGLTVGGHLGIRNLPSLKRFPRGLRVEGALFLSDSDEIPEPSPDMEVEESIHIHPRFLDRAWPAHLRRKIVVEPLDPTAPPLLEGLIRSRGRSALRGKQPVNPWVTVP